MSTGPPDMTTTIMGFVVAFLMASKRSCCIPGNVKSLWSWPSLAIHVSRIEIYIQLLCGSAFSYNTLLIYTSRPFLGLVQANHNNDSLTFLNHWHCFLKSTIISTFNITSLCWCHTISHWLYSIQRRNKKRRCTL